MFLLCILDGFGLRQEKENNAVLGARKPNVDKLFATCPFAAIDGSGLAVGLPDGQMGNSEVGHLNIGAGRVVYQDVTRIDKSISDGDFFTNKVFVDGMKRAVANNKAVHLFGLISDGCVHSSLNHLQALAKMAKDNGVTRLYLHAFMDGRDTSPQSGAGYMQATVDYFKKIGLGKVATVSGRYYGMDRDKRWERVEKSYDVIVRRRGVEAKNPVEAIKKSYKDGVTDEFIMPVVNDLGGQNEGRLENDDVAIFFNFRADRVRQLCHILTGDDPEGWAHPDNPSIYLITMTQYDKLLTKARVAFPQIPLTNIFGEVISKHGMKQLRIAETEKYAHVTFFFNGGVEKPFEGEERIMIPSPKVATYDLKPEMSSVEVSDAAAKAIRSGKFDVVILNFANCDMVGHTGIYSAAVKAVEAVDTGLGKVLAAVKEQRGMAIVTADHGNAEMMYDESTHGPHTAHTTNLVPCIFYDSAGKLGDVRVRDGGILADLAPTMLHCLGIEPPAEMTGRNLLVPSEIPVKRN